MNGIIKIASQIKPKEAFDELLRRHILPVVESQGTKMASVFRKGGSPMRDILKETAARGGKVSPDAKMKMRKMKLKFRGKRDEELLSITSSSQNLSQMSQLMRRIIEAQNRPKKG